MNDTDNPYLSPEASAESPVIVAELVEEPKRPWGFWMTIVASVAVAAVFFAVQTGVAVTIFFGAVASGQVKFDGSPQVVEEFVSTGWMMAIATWASLPCTVGTMYFFVRLRRRWKFGEYLGWEPVPATKTALWLAAAVTFAVMNDVLCRLSGIEIVSDFQRQITETAGWAPLVWSAVVLAAPLGEEFFFRGLLFRGLQATRLGNVGTMLITSLVWAAIHTQYNFAGVFAIFVFGCLLGTARAVTGSCRLAVWMHLLLNVIATAEVYVFG
jgi:membrane protease YdiL (CAAX protease family)